MLIFVPCLQVVEYINATGEAERMYRLHKQYVVVFNVYK